MATIIKPVADLTASFAALSKEILKTQSNVSRLQNSFSLDIKGITSSITKIGPPLAAFSTGAFFLLKNNILEIEKQTQSLRARFQGLSETDLTRLAYQIQNISHQIGISQEEATSMFNVLSNYKIDNSNIQSAMGVVSAIATTTGQSIDSITRNLGKMLTDPKGGLTALSTEGVKFSDSFKKGLEGISEPVARQKAIIAELTDQFGESAAAGAGTLTKAFGGMDAAFTHLRQAIFGVGTEATDVLASLTNAFTWLIQTTADFIQSIKWIVGSAFSWISTEAANLVISIENGLKILPNAFKEMANNSYLVIAKFINNAIDSFNDMFNTANIIFNHFDIPTIEITTKLAEIKPFELEKTEKLAAAFLNDFDRVLTNKAAELQIGDVLKNLPTSSNINVDTEDAVKSVAKLGESVKNTTEKLKEIKSATDIYMEELAKLTTELTNLGATDFEIKLEGLAKIGVTDEQLENLRILNTEIENSKVLIDLASESQKWLEDLRHMGLSTEEKELAILQEKITLVKELAKTEQDTKTLQVLQQQESQKIEQIRQQQIDEYNNSIELSINNVLDLGAAWSKSGNHMQKAILLLETIKSVSNSISAYNEVSNIISTGTQAVQSQVNAGSAGLASILKDGFSSLLGATGKQTTATNKVAANTTPVKTDNLKTAIIL